MENSINHNCFKNLQKLPVTYAANNKAKMISDMIFCGLCIVIYLHNEDQQDALFPFNFFKQSSSTCFE